MLNRSPLERISAVKAYCDPFMGNI